MSPNPFFFFNSTLILNALREKNPYSRNGDVGKKKKHTHTFFILYLLLLFVQFNLQKYYYILNRMLPTVRYLGLTFDRRMIWGPG